MSQNTRWRIFAATFVYTHVYVHLAAHTCTLILLVSCRFFPFLRQDLTVHSVALVGLELTEIDCLCLPRAGNNGLPLLPFSKDLESAKLDSM